MRLPSTLLATLILTLTLAACAEFTDILGDVKTGTLPSTSRPIGQAFDAAFPGGTWTASTTGMGEMYAFFRSTTTAEALEAAGVPEVDHNCLAGYSVRAGFQCRLTSCSHRASSTPSRSPK